MVGIRQNPIGTDHENVEHGIWGDESMADVFLTVNGIGHGHLMRALRICRWLRRTGRHPLFFHQGRYSAEAALRFPGTSIPTLYQLDRGEAQRLADEIARVARLSHPSLILEDTHPAEVSFPREIKRVLFVRPTVPEHMRMLRKQYSQVFSRIIVCDHPDSPTWPYSAADTREFLQYGWQVVGPIFRRHTSAGIERVRRRHRIRIDDQVIVFSLGGGGEQPGTQDRTRFIEQATTIAEQLRSSSPSLRLFFVCGPLFPADLRIPPEFEVIQEEPDMPSLFAEAKAAVIRPGYNSIWECIAAQTPFVPLPGTTYMEPMLQRLEQLKRAGFNIPDAFSDAIADTNWRDSFRLASQRILRRFSGSPESEVVEIIQSVAAKSEPNGVVARRAPEHRPRQKTGKSTLSAEDRFLAIRVECVVELCPSLRWIASVCQSRSLYASLEVVPYLSLSNLNSLVLDEIDPQQRLEVSQHGYSHVPALARDSRRLSEFERENPSAVDMAQLRRGFRLLRYRFRKRFKGGYSPPYDCLPDWLPQYWRSIGGGYISVVKPDPIQGWTPTATATSWIRIGRGCTISDLTTGMARRWQETGRAGIAVDIRELASSKQRTLIERALDFAMEHDCQGVRPSDYSLVSPATG